MKQTREQQLKKLAHDLGMKSRQSHIQDLSKND